MGVRCVPILLKNSVIWMQKISDEPQKSRHFTYK
jgi:hypothetical protein